MFSVRSCDVAALLGFVPNLINSDADIFVECNIYSNSDAGQGVHHCIASMSTEDIYLHNTNLIYF